MDKTGEYLFLNKVYDFNRNKKRRSIFPLSKMYSGVSSDYEGCRLNLRGNNWSLGRIAHDSHGNAKCEIPLQ